MASTIQIKRGTGSAVPSGLSDGELAINLDSGKLYFGSGSTSVNSFRFTNLTADNYIVSSSVTNYTFQTLSGSSDFGDDTGDIHNRTGSLKITGSLQLNGSNVLTSVPIDTSGLKSLKINASGQTGSLTVGPAARQIELRGGSTFTSTNPRILSSTGIIEVDDAIQMNSHLIYFHEGATNSYIGVDIFTPDNLRIHANQDLYLVPDDNLIISSSTSAKTISYNNFDLRGELTASGNISSSGTIVASNLLQNSDTASFVINSQTGSFSTITQLNASSSTLQTNINAKSSIVQLNTSSSALQTNINAKATTGSSVLFTNITASGNISSSGTITANSIVGTVGTATQGTIDHDSLANFVANEHIDHSGVSITAGAGLTGGGTIASTRDIAVGAGTGVTVNANDVAIGQDVATTANVLFNHVTSSGNISSSGNLITTTLQFTGTDTSENATHYLEFKKPGNTVSNITNGVSINPSSDTMILGGVTTIAGQAGTITGLTSLTSTNITSSGNISASGTIFANQIETDQLVSHIGDANTGLQFDSDTVTIQGNNEHIALFASNRIEFTENLNSTHYISGSSLISDSHITASGNISSSGTITAATLDATAVSDTLAAAIVAEIDNDEIPIAKLAEDAVTINSGTNLSGGGAVTLGGAITLNVDDAFLKNNADDTTSGKLTTAGLNSTSHITASGNISASGTVTANSIVGTVGTATQGTIDHDSLANFVANEHIDHSGVSITAGAGLTGGGTIAATRTLSINSASIAPFFSSSANNFYTVGFVSASGDLTIGGKSQFIGNITASGNISASGDIEVANTIFFDGQNHIVGHHASDGLQIRTQNAEPIVFKTNGNNIRATIAADGETTFAGVLNSTKLNTGQGDNELYAMNQDVETTDNVLFNNITASGNISASGDIIGDNLFMRNHIAVAETSNTIAFGFENDTAIQIGKQANPTKIIGHITASGNISSSGTIFTDEISSPANNLTISSSTVTITSTTAGEANLILEADTDNNDENDNPFMSFKQDSGGIAGMIGLSGDADKWPDGTTLTGVTANAMVIGMTGSASSTNRQLYLAAGNSASLRVENDADIHIYENLNVTKTISVADTSVVDYGITNANTLTFGRANRPTIFQGTSFNAQTNITASGNISSSGTITANSIVGTVGTATQGTIDHDSLANFVANEHIDHSAVSVIAGDGLTGGGTIAANRTIAIGAGTGIDVAADAISVDVSDFMANGSNNRVITATGTDAMNGEANLLFDGSTLTTRGATGQLRVESTDTSVVDGQNFAKIVFTDIDGASDDNAEIRAVATEDHEDSTPAVGSKLEFRASQKQDASGGHLMLTLDPDTNATFAVPVVDGGRTIVKILPTDFVPNDGGRPVMIEDDSIGSNELFLFSQGSFDMYAYIEIPHGMTATHVKIFGSDTSQNFTTYEGNTNSKTIAVKGSATAIGTEKDITDVACTTTNYLVILVSSDGSTDEIYGGYVKIIPS